MSQILKRFCPKTEFESYDDFLSNYTVAEPETFNFGYDVVDAWAEIDKNKLALVWTNDDCDMKSYTFGDMKEMSNRAANFFVSRGIQKGDTVMLILKQRPEVWFAIVALCKIGATCIPASYQLTPKDISYRCNVSGVKMIVSVGDDEIIGHINTALPDCKNDIMLASVYDGEVADYINFRTEIAKQSTEFPRPTGDKATVIRDTMLIYFSSGTTGMPKMVRHDHSHPLGQIVTAKYWQSVQDNKIHMTQTDSGWAKFAWGKIYGQWICGAAIGAYDTEKFTPHSMLEAVMRIKPTTFCAPATIFRFLIKEDLSGYDFSFIEHASLAGEPLNPEVFNKIKELTGLEIYEGFGQSESSVLLANFKWMNIKPGSMGKPAAVYDIDLLDENGESCEDGVPGLICVKNVDVKNPTGLFIEYYRDPEANQKSRHFGAYSTGDMAWRDDEGYFWYVGRNDDVIKCSGYRIGPFEVESALMEHQSVLECAITAIEDPMRGQVVKATIVLDKKNGWKPSDELTKELQNHVKRVTAPYKYPRVVEYVDELPKTVSGKIMRTSIRASDMQKSMNK